MLPGRFPCAGACCASRHSAGTCARLLVSDSAPSAHHGNGLNELWFACSALGAEDGSCSQFRSCSPCRDGMQRSSPTLHGRGACDAWVYYWVTLYSGTGGAGAAVRRTAARAEPGAGRAQRVLHRLRRRANHAPVEITVFAEHSSCTCSLCLPLHLLISTWSCHVTQDLANPRGVSQKSFTCSMIRHVSG